MGRAVQFKPFKHFGSAHAMASNYLHSAHALGASDQDLEASHFDGQSWIGYRTYVRLVREASNSHKPRRIRTPSDIFEVFSGLSECDREQFYSVHLDSQHQVCGIELVTQGTLDTSLITPREVYKSAILANAQSLILIHNHPSGNPEPSHEDHSITKTLVSSGEVLGIQVLDHVIIGDNRYFSFQEANLL